MESDAIEVKELSTGYVRVRNGVGGWAQLPSYAWGCLIPGGLVPDEYTFEPSWSRVRKPKAQQ